MSEQSAEPTDGKTVLDLQKQYHEQFEKIVKGLAEVEKTNKGNSEGLAKIDKIAVDVSGFIDSNNKIDAKLATVTKSVEQLQKLSFSMPGAVDAEKTKSKKLEAKYEASLKSYIYDKSAIDKDLVKEITDHILKTEYAHATDKGLAAIRKTLQEGVNPDGGYWVIPQRVTQMVTRIFETSPLLQLAGSQSTSSNSIEIVIDDEDAIIQGAVGELETPIVQITPTIGLLTIPVHRIASGRHRVTQDLIDDASFDVIGWLMRKIADRLRRQLNSDMIIGTGALRARGILTYPDSAAPGVYERGAVEQVVSTNATDFTYDGFVDIQSSLKEEYQGSAVWLMRRQSFANVLKIKSVDDVPLINANQLAQAPTRVILGNRVLFADDFPAVGAGALAAAYGTYNPGYTVVPRIGIRILRDPFTANPLISFTSDMRQGGDVTNYESFKIHRIST